MIKLKNCVTLKAREHVKLPVNQLTSRLISLISLTAGESAKLRHFGTYNFARFEDWQRSNSESQTEYTVNGVNC